MNNISHRNTAFLNVLILLPVLYLSVSIFYGFKNIDRLENAAIYFVFYGALLALVLPALFTSSDAKVNYVLSIVTTIICVFVGETVLQFNDIESASFDIVERKSPLQRTHINILEESPVFQSLGSKSWPVLNIKAAVDEFRNKDIFPLAGISAVLTLHCSEIGLVNSYISDRFGFNNPDNQYELISHDFMLVGDSLIHGNCVPENMNTSAFLRKMGYAGLSIGYEGMGPLSELAALSEYAPYTKPKNIIWLFSDGNDIDDYNFEHKREILSKYENDPNFRQNLTNRQNEIDEIWKQRVIKKLSAPPKSNQLSIPNIDNFIFYAENIAKLRNLRKIMGTKFSFPPKCLSFIDPFSTILNRALEVIAPWGGKLHFVYLATDLGERSVDHACKPAILDAVKKMGVRVLDFEYVLRTHENDGPFQHVKGGHYNPNGYKFLATYIAQMFL